MQKVISKYGLAAHLALMAVAPLFLLPFAGMQATAIVLLWLSAFGTVWVIMEPSRRRTELPHEARARVSRAIMRDPLFWLSLVLVAMGFVRVLNGGIGLAYDAELMTWSIREPVFPLLPGCVTGCGLLPLSVLVALMVIFQGTRHALGRSARVSFLFVLSFLSSVAAIVLSFMLSYHHAGTVQLTHYSVLSASWFGVAFGLMFLAGLAAVILVVEQHWVKTEPLAVIALSGNAIGLVMFSPPFVIAVFLGAFLLLAVVSFALERHVFEGSGSFRCALSILMALTASALYLMSVPEMAGKLAEIKGMVFFPEGFWTLRDTLSAIALKTWKANPWLGTGLGSFPLALRFGATAADWSVVSPAQLTELNGWWQLLMERGVVGASLMAVALGMLLWTYVSRFIDTFRSVHFSPEHLVGLISIFALVALAFFDCSYLRPEVLLLAGSLFAFSGGAFPERVRDADDVKDN